MLRPLAEIGCFERRQRDARPVADRRGFFESDARWHVRMTITRGRGIDATIRILERAKGSQLPARGINHIDLAVVDVDRSIAFYDVGMTASGATFRSISRPRKIATSAATGRSSFRSGRDPSGGPLLSGSRIADAVVDIGGGWSASRSVCGSCARRALTAGATGLEPATSGVTGRRSNQLNYTPVGLGIVATRFGSGGPTVA